MSILQDIFIRILMVNPGEHVFESDFGARHAATLGWLCTYTPEELIIACGFTPVRLRGCDRCIPQTSHLPSNLCPYVRSILDQAGGESVRNLAALSLVASCDAMRRLADAWKRRFPGMPVHVIDSPRRTDRGAHAYLVSRYRAFLAFLSQVSGRRPEESELRDAVVLVNRKRRLLTQISELRKKEPPGISGSEFFDLVSSSFRMRPGEFLEKYGSFVPQAAVTGARLVIAGSILESDMLYRAVEESGANVVAEDICTGLRGISGLTRAEGSPLENIASRYLVKSPCSRMYGTESRTASLLALVREYRAQGVLFHSLKFCDQYQYDYAVVKTQLERKGIPVLRIETDYQAATRGQIATRLEAFTEALAWAAISPEGRRP
jgi:benzoyl-CoA reductase/2-hydroxyglutaryl-CoA dehydratase subunit BcrC/BadD/HgdB